MDTFNEENETETIDEFINLQKREKNTSNLKQELIFNRLQKKQEKEKTKRLKKGLRIC